MSGGREAGPADGERAWVRAAVERFEAPLVRYASRLAGDAERARDTVQETFLRLCTQPRAEVEPHLAEWLYTVCRRLALDGRRREKRMRPLSETSAERVTSRGPTPPEALEQAETRAEALQALDELPENQQEVLRLKFQHGLSYQEISRVTELTTGHVGFLIHMGLKAIRERMGVIPTEPAGRSK